MVNKLSIFEAFAGSKRSPSALTTLKALFGLLPKPTDPSVPLVTRFSNERADSEKGELSTHESPVAKESAEADWRIAVRDVDMDRDAGAEINGHEEAYMTIRERVDFLILFLEFGVLVAG